MTLPSESLGVVAYAANDLRVEPVPLREPVAPAIATAIEDAIGVRIRDLPITAEKIYVALRDR